MVDKILQILAYIQIHDYVNMNIQTNMSEKIYSDTSDKFLCDILSKKCSDFLSTYSNTFNPIPTSSQLYEINPLTLAQSLKNEKLRPQKLPVLPKNMTPYERMLSNNSAPTKKSSKQKDQQIRDKEEQLLVELMKKIIENLKTNLSKLLNRLEGFPNKEAFKSIVYTLQDQFQLVNMELERVCKYTKKKQIRDIFMFQICSIHPPDFVELVFENLPVLREYFSKFQLPTLTNQQIQQLKQGSSLIYYLTEFNALLQQRAKQKKIKKRQNKKKNKQLKNEGLQKTQEEPKMVQVVTVEETKENKIAEFLNSMVISQERMTCNASDDWMEMLKMRYVC